MADIFLGYASEDREKVEDFFAALSQHGFEVFWDQIIPGGENWESWIKDRLSSSQAALVFWSSNSVGSEYVIHEASIAKDEGKLIPILLETVDTKDFPLGLQLEQALDFSEWSGSTSHGQFGRLVSLLEDRLAPAWVQRRMAKLERDTADERKKRLTAESDASEINNRLQQEIGKTQGRQDELDKKTIQLGKANETLSSNKKEIDELASKLEKAEAQIKPTSKLRRLVAPAALISGVALGFFSGLPNGFVTPQVTQSDAYLELDGKLIETERDLASLRVDIEKQRDLTKAVEQDASDASAELASQLSKVAELKQALETANREKSDVLDQISRQETTIASYENKLAQDDILDLQQEIIQRSRKSTISRLLAATATLMNRDYFDYTDSYRYGADEWEEFRLDVLLPLRSVMNDSVGGVRTAIDQVVPRLESEGRFLSFEGIDPLFLEKLRFADVGQAFSDCPECEFAPEMVITSLPMPITEDADVPEVRQPETSSAERFNVSNKQIAVSTKEITVGQFSAFVTETGYDGYPTSCRTKEDDELIPRDGRDFRNNPISDGSSNAPAVCLTKKDAEAYAGWLTNLVSIGYRLPTESEYRHFASLESRAGVSNLTNTINEWMNDCPDEKCDRVYIRQSNGGRLRLDPETSRQSIGFRLVREIVSLQEVDTAAPAE